MNTQRTFIASAQRYATGRKRKFAVELFGARKGRRGDSRVAELKRLLLSKAVLGKILFCVKRSVAISKIPTRFR